MNEQLYRKEAFQSRVRGFTNPVSIRGSISATILLVLVLSVLAGLGTYGYYTDYARKVTVAGSLTPGKGSLSLPAPTSGQVSFVAKNGQHVKKGELLAVVRDRRVGDEADTEADIQIEALKGRKALIEERMALLDERAAVSERTFSSRANALKRKQEMHVHVMNVLNRQNDVAAGKLARAQTLHDKKRTTEDVLDAAVMNNLTTSQQLIDAELAAGEIENALLSLEAELKDARIAARVERVSLRDEVMSIQNEIKRIEARREMELFSPLDGVVTLSHARDLTVVNAGDPLFAIDSLEDAYRAVLLAPSSAIGFLKEGDEVKLRYDAFPFREHGVFSGTVTDIDKAALLPAISQQAAGVGQPVYRVFLEIDQTPISKTGQPLRLASGMRLEGSILIDEKPILFWLLNPVL